MNWKNLKLNPPTETCWIATKHPDQSEWNRHHIFRYIAHEGINTGIVTNVTISLDHISRDLMYINLDDVVNG